MGIPRNARIVTLALLLHAAGSPSVARSGEPGWTWRHEDPAITGRLEAMGGDTGSGQLFGPAGTGAHRTEAWKLDLVTRRLSRDRFASPSWRYVRGAPVVSDRVRGLTLMFGGEYMGLPYPYFGDSRTLVTGKVGRAPIWAEQDTPIPARWGSVLAHDTNRDRYVVLGGQSTNQYSSPWHDIWAAPAPGASGWTRVIAD